MPDRQTSRTVNLSHQPVELYKILKFEGLIASGAQAKLVIDDGLVTVNGQVETRRRRKIVHGDVIAFEDVALAIVFSEMPDS